MSIYKSGIGRRSENVPYTGEHIKDTETNLSATYPVLDATENNFVFDVDFTGNGTGVYKLLYQLPQDFEEFAGSSDDISVRAIQDGDSGDGADVEISIDVADASGTNADDGSVTETTLTLSYATYDCAVTGGSFSAGDYIVITITLGGATTTETGDGARFTIPKVKYLTKEEYN